VRNGFVCFSFFLFEERHDFGLDLTWARCVVPLCVFLRKPPTVCFFSIRGTEFPQTKDDDDGTTFAGRKGKSGRCMTTATWPDDKGCEDSAFWKCEKLKTTRTVFEFMFFEETCEGGGLLSFVSNSTAPQRKQK